MKGISASSPLASSLWHRHDHNRSWPIVYKSCEAPADSIWYLFLYISFFVLIFVCYSLGIFLLLVLLIQSSPQISTSLYRLWCVLLPSFTLSSSPSSLNCCPCCYSPLTFTFAVTTVQSCIINNHHHHHHRHHNRFFLLLYRIICCFLLLSAVTFCVG